VSDGNEPKERVVFTPSDRFRASVDGLAKALGRSSNDVAREMAEMGEALFRSTYAAKTANELGRVRGGRKL
jgi:hypothetical protein